MATIYRALWDEPDAGDGVVAVQRAARCFGEWASPEAPLQLGADGEWALALPGPALVTRSVTFRQLDRDGARGFRATARDESEAPSGSRNTWTTTLSIVADEQGAHVWVENALETDDVLQRVKVGRPRLVSDLLAGPGRHVLGGSAVREDATPVTAEAVPALVEVLKSPERRLPIIAFSEPSSGGAQWLEWARRVASRAGGVATVVTLDRTATQAMRSALGDLAVWGGAVRTYTLAPLLSASDGWRHRYFVAQRLADDGPGVVDRLVFSAAQLSTRRRVPTIFGALTEAASAADSERFAAAEEQWAFDLELEQEERREVEKELSRALGHLQRLARSLEKQGLSDVYWGARDAAADDLPEDVQDVSEAVLAARTYLTDWLEIPDEAEQELDGIDAAPNAYAWGNTTLRGLRALAEYVKARRAGFDGGFWEWCDRGEPGAWPASTKKLAMRESETVANNSRFVKARQFRIDPRVSPDGYQYMESHLKISEGGGDLAPRVYFHDDTAGQTGKVHIGFVGPHYLVPNTRS
jgi:hypothetical protein